MTLDDGPLENMSDWEPLTHSVLNVTLDGRHMEGIPDPEPLEHSVLVMALDSELTEGMSHLEPLEHSVLNAALVARPMEETPDKEPLKHSVLNVALDDGLAQESGEPTFGSDRGLISTDFRTVICASMISIRRDFGVGTRIEIFYISITHLINGLPVYYGGDLEWDDPYALASAAYVEGYNCYVPEGMDFMVHSQSRLHDGSEAQEDGHTDMVPVCQMVSCVTRKGWDVFDDDSLTEAAVVDSPNMDDYYHRVVLLDEDGLYCFRHWI